MKVKHIFRLLVLIILVLAMLPTQRTAKANIYTVTNTTAFGHGSLREAITLANANSGVRDTIKFDIIGCSGACVINPTNTYPLPILTDDAGLIIDGTSQTAISDSNPSGPEIEINGLLIDEISDPPIPVDALKSGINIASSNNVIKGLVINDFPLHGIALAKVFSSDVVSNTISGNYIGVDAECTRATPNGFYGIYLGPGAQNNTIGGAVVEDRNIISGNGSAGVWIHGNGADLNVVIGNYIGTGRTAYGQIPNGTHGVYITGGAKNNTIGGSAEDERNIISGNTIDGVRIYGSGTNGNILIGNHIGTDKAGTGSLPNEEHGVQIMHGAQSNLIGGTSDGERNIISGNLMSGVYITGTTTIITNTMSNRVVGNYIGLSDTGWSAEANGHYGVYIGGGAEDNIVGGDSGDHRNLISGNARAGVAIVGTGTQDNIISANFIGTDDYGNSDVGNGHSGVYISQANNNVVGGDTAGERNIISGNLSHGVRLVNPGTTGNVISGNRIGTRRTGTVAVSNQGDGVHIADGAQDNFIGGDSPDEANLISGNVMNGIAIAGADTSGNTVSGNYIGTTVYLHSSMGNGEHGVDLSDGAHHNTIGGDSIAEGNQISGNDEAGVSVNGEDTDNNIVSANLIGTDAQGSDSVSNDWAGVQIEHGAQNNIIGGDTPTERNLISGNGFFGVILVHEETTGNTIIGNYIGTNITGTAALENESYGIVLSEGATGNTIGGASNALGNLVSGNGGSGLIITGTNTMSNTILGNYIGVDVSGGDLHNEAPGIELSSGAQENAIGPGNVIAHNWGDGVLVSEAATLGNLITQNSIFSNDYGINLEDGSHGAIPAPTITAVTSGNTVTGTACTGCVIEVFGNSTPDGEGESFIGSTTASGSGAFTLVALIPSIFNLTATATDERGTSEFSEVFNTGYPIFLPLALNGE